MTDFVVDELLAFKAAIASPSFRGGFLHFYFNGYLIIDSNIVSLRGH